VTKTSTSYPEKEEPRRVPTRQFGLKLTQQAGEELVRKKLKMQRREESRVLKKASSCFKGTSTCQICQTFT